MVKQDPHERAARGVADEDGRRRELADQRLEMFDDL
jgi:hypothetical protein